MPSPLHHDADASTASPHLHPNDSNSNGNSNGNNGNITDRNHLAPEDAFYTHSSPPRWQRHRHPSPNSRPTSPSPKSPAAPSSPPRRRRRDKPRGRSTSRRRRLRTWKKLLWVKQSYPDNYTDHQTFLSQLQRNPRFQPYDFWPLMADSTVIVQHVCSVVIFACCFVGIHQKRVSPVGVVSWGNAGTVVGWGLWDWWVGKAGEGEAAEVSVGEGAGAAAEEGSETAGSAGSSTVGAREYANGLGLKFSAATAAMASPHRPTHSHSTSGASTHSTASLSSPASLPPNSPPPFFSPRNHQRLATAKSAILIYYALLGLSPILKSLTRSTTPDSIWAMSAWLMCINVFFFDYGGEVKFPASLSTNAALMASTVLASRLPSTSHVFSLTLFSIEVFGLFPVFRRHLRHISWVGHLLLTVSLVVGAGAGVAVTVSGGGWKAAVFGGVGGSVVMGGAMGGCSWWLIGLQKYKNEIHGPWDPARPVIRRRWD